MNCPYCKEEMQKGFVQCRDGVTWTPKKQWVSALSALGKGAVHLGGADGADKNAVSAYRCSTCKCVIIPYGNAELEKD